ncbi:MAG: aldehyde dehydrogenase family protein [Bdellovibrionota bacterium]
MNFIGGEFIGAREGGTFAHVDPSTGAEDLRVADSGLLDVVFAVQAANKAYQDWSKSSPEDRAVFLESAARLIEERSTVLAEALSRDQGTLLGRARTWSVPRAAEEFRHHAKILSQAAASPVVRGNVETTTNRLPIGLVGILTPWVDAIAIMASRVSAALAAGNVVILKASEHAPRTAHAFAEILRDTGLPAGVFNLLQGRGEQAGASLVEHPGISTLSFVGSTETGRLVARSAAESLKRVHLSLGARNPVLVFASVDLATVVPQVAAVTLGAHPRLCWRGSRLFVQDPIYKDFLAAFKSEVEKWKTGPALDESSRLGPLAHAGLARRFESVAAQATNERGKWLFGGSGADRGAFVNPSATFDFTLCSTLQQDEILGPMMTIASFKYQHDAVKQANNSPLGQAAFVFEKDPEKAAKIALKIEAGRVFVNTSEPTDDIEVSTGGLKLSGSGRENSDELIKFFSRETTIATSVSR